MNLFKNEFELSSSNFNKLFEFLQVLNQQISSLQAIISSDQVEELTKFIKIRNQHESLCVLRFLLDIVEKLEYYAYQHKMYGVVVMNFCKDIKSDYLDLFGEEQTEVDFTNRATLISLHTFINNISEKLSTNFQLQEKLVNKINQCLNVFYVDVIDSLCLNNPWKKPSDNAVEIILSVITSKQINDGRTHAFELGIASRTLLVQMVFKNYKQDIVINHLKRWFKNESFMGKNAIFKDGIEVSIMFVNSVYEQMVQETCENRKEILLSNALDHSLALLNHKVQLVNIFKTRKIMGITYDVNELLLIAKFKFACSMLVRCAYSSDVFEKFQSNPVFNSFNKTMKELLSYVEDVTTTLANYLIKEFVRKHGSSSLNFIMTNKELMWITPKSIVGEERVSLAFYVI